MGRNRDVEELLTATSALDIVARPMLAPPPIHVIHPNHHLICAPRVIPIQVVHGLVLGEVLEFAADGLALLQMELFVNVAAVVGEEPQESQEDHVDDAGDDVRVEDPH